LLQIDETVPPEVLFSNYIYVSGTSDWIREHARWLASRFTRECGLQRGDLVLEVASNDGTVLKAFRPYDVTTVGIEPAANIAEIANRDGVETVCAFFGRESAEEMRARYGPARLILARHVLAHVADLNGFVAGLATALAGDGLVAVEVPHLLSLHDKLEFDTIYHEHLCYFSVRALKALFALHDLELVDVQRLAIHGGSILVAAQHQGGPYAPQSSVGRVLAVEDQAGLHRVQTWLAFAVRVARAREALLAEIDRLRSAGQTLAGYGAAAKGMTLLAYCGIGPERLPYLVDRSPYKQGLLTPGHHIPVHATGKLVHDMPDVVLLLAWNFAAEIARQQAEYLRRGGQFLIPIPGPHYWTKGRNVRPEWQPTRRAG
jgi:hypothetical protein